MENIIISNPEKFEEKKKKILEGGADKFHVIADFDKTLTHAFTDGNKVQSIIAVLRNKNYLTPDYPEKAHALFDRYHPIEVNPDVSIEEKKKKMEEWWTKHSDLLIKSGLNKEDLKKLVEENEIRLRDGVLEFIDFLYNKKIPLVIMSASGVGNAIRLCLEKEKRLYDNVNIVSNLFEWNTEGKAISVKQPIIHSMNKDETTLESLPIYLELMNKKNVLLLGDGLGDLGMIKGFDYDNLISIGFLNENVDKNLEKFKENFDVVLLGDGDFSFVNEFVKNFNK
jgi:5'-nucleotidase